MERTLEVRTADNVEVSYELAGLGSRFLAVAIDMVIQVATLLALSIAGVVSMRVTVRAAHALNLPPSVESAEMAIAIVAAFALFVGYFVAFETWWHGLTPGKRALGIRVLRDGAFPIDLMSALVRNLVRSVEFAAGFYTISAISVLVSPSNKRLGDYAAGTIVVRNHAGSASAYHGPGRIR